MVTWSHLKLLQKAAAFYTVGWFGPLCTPCFSFFGLLLPAKLSYCYLGADCQETRTLIFRSGFMSDLLIVYNTAEDRGLPMLFFSQYLSQLNAGSPIHTLSLLSKARELFESQRWEMKLHTILGMKHHMKTLNHPVWSRHNRDMHTSKRTSGAAMNRNTL